MTPLTLLSISLLTIFSFIHGESQQYSFISANSAKTADLYFEANEVDKPPVLINRDEIEDLIGYPSLAWNAGIEGKVVLKILVDKNGYYLKHEVKESFHPLLRIPCENYVQFLAFSPARKNGNTVNCWLEVPFEFSIP
ncbi:MAG: energy transducer TonB [Bacteroidetes bacterium]|nr:energy transducer TonB [Bacteroidota bacterium]MCB0843828.1 energy transducer TonB [Bacteroidota bacterium]